MTSAIGTLHKSVVFDRRARVLAQHLTAVLSEKGEVLDVGCGDGTVGALILQRSANIRLRGVDVFERPKTRIPVDVFDGRTLPYPDKSFDTVMFVDVLHHTSDPMVLLRETCRVGRIGWS